MAIAACSRASAASSGVVVTTTILSATSLDATACTSASRSFGPLSANSSTMLAAPCHVVFGSSNDVARLRLLQADGRGSAMFKPSTGSRDTGWGAGGVRLAAVGPASDQAKNLAIAPDGTAYVGGWSNEAGVWKIRVVKVLPTGALDGAYGTAGVLTTPLAVDPVYRYDIGLELQPDGKLLVAGSAPGTGLDFAVARYDATGTPDGGFGTGGLATVPSAAEQWGHDVVLLPDGSMVVVGESNLPGDWDVSAVKFSQAGAWDGSFGTAGIARFNSTGARWDFAYSGSLLADGRIVLGGSSEVAGGYSATMMMMTAAGGIDGSFASSGWLIATLGTSDAVRDVRALANGDIVAVGNTQGAYGNALLGGFTGAGAAAAGWGATGWRIIDSGAASSLQSVLELPSGQLVAAGARVVGGVQRTALLRTSSTGTADATFGTNGWVDDTVGAASSSGQEVRSDVDGTLMVAGIATGTDVDFATTRYKSLSVTDFASGSADWSAGTQAFGACLETTSSSASSAPWVAAGSGACSAANGPGWRGIARTSADTGAVVATASSTGTVNASVDLHFGLRIPASQEPGSYIAPVTFEVVAP